LRNCRSNWASRAPPRAADRPRTRLIRALVIWIDPSAACLAVGLPALALEPPVHTCPRGPGGVAGRLDAERARQALGEALERQRAVASLRPLVSGDHAHLWSQPLEEAGPLTGAERRRALDVEPDLDPGVGGVGVLAAWSS
jgi:hypothetical protein